MITMEKSTSEYPANMDQPTDKASDRERYAGLRSSGDRHSASSSFEMGTVEDQIFSMSEIDPVLDAKMRLVNKV